MTTPDLTLFQAQPDPMWVRDEAARETMAVNAAALARYGLDEAAFLGLDPDALVVAPGAPDYPEWARSSSVIDEIHRLPDGTLLPVMAERRPVRLDGRDATLVIARDAAWAVAVELEARRSRSTLASTGDALAQAESQLEISEERFRKVAEAIADVVWDWDVLADRIWRSSGRQGLLRSRNEPSVSGFDFWRERLHPDDVEEAVARLRAVLADPDCRDWEHVYRMRRDDGTWAQIRDRGSVVRDADGRAVRMVGAMLDITAQRQLEEQLQRSQRLDAIGQLTGGVAHDFNNLLTVILGNTDLIAAAAGDKPRIVSLVNMTRTAAERGAELTRRLLAFARRQALDPGVTDIDELLSGMFELLHRTLGDHVEVALERGEGVWQAMVDASQLENALLNLCLNARDAMPGGGRIRIRTGNVTLAGDEDIHDGEVRPGDYVTVSVIDSGIGMAPEVIGHVFEPFFTTKETGKGSGLGLSMVYGFVKQSAGHVRIASEPGRGTTVTLYLPRAPAPPSAVAAAEAPDEVVGGSERILVVEDDPIVRVFVENQLHGLGYRVVTASAGAEALSLLDAGEPVDLLFTDIVMPGGMNGRELADAVLERRPGLPVLFTSGYTEVGVVRDGVLDSDVDLLHKPYRRAELAARIRRALARGGAARGEDRP